MSDYHKGGRGRPRINFEVTSARFPEGTIAAIERLKDPEEPTSDFIRNAVLREIQRRAQIDTDEPNNPFD